MDILAPRNAPHVVHVDSQNILAVEQYLAVDNLAGRIGDKAHQREGANTLAATTFSNQAEGFPFFDLVRYAIHRFDDTFKGVEVSPSSR